VCQESKHTLSDLIVISHTLSPFSDDTRENRETERLTKLTPDTEILN